MADGTVVLFCSVSGNIHEGDFCVTFTGQIYLLVVVCVHHGVLKVTHYCQTCGGWCCFNINKQHF